MSTFDPRNLDATRCPCCGTPEAERPEYACEACMARLSNAEIDKLIAERQSESPHLFEPRREHEDNSGETLDTLGQAGPEELVGNDEFDAFVSETNPAETATDEELEEGEGEASPIAKTVESE